MLGQDNQSVVLVVDDDAMSRMKISVAVSKLGHKVIKAAGGDEALELLQQESVDLMLLDLLMPEMDGFEVLLTMQKLPDADRVPVVVISSLDSPEDTTRAMALGARQCISKGFDAAGLEQCISEVLSA